MHDAARVGGHETDPGLGVEGAAQVAVGEAEPVSIRSKSIVSKVFMYT